LHIFLAHSSVDKPAARDLFGRLRAEGFQPWLDEESLLPGQNWQREIERAIRESDVIIACLSQASVSKRGYLQKELSYALDVAEEQPEGAVFFIPLKLEECEMPERLWKWQWVNLFESNGYKRLIDALKFRTNALKKSVVAVGSLEASIEAILSDVSTGILESKYVEFSAHIADLLNEFSRLVGLGPPTKKEAQGLAAFTIDTGNVFEGLPFPNPVLVIASDDKEVLDPTIQHLHHLLIEKNASSGSRIVILILFCDAEALGRARRRVAKVFGDVYAYDVVILGHRDLLTIAAAKDPERVLRGFILSQIDLTTVAPYTITGPTPDTFFFGREHELREITEHAASVSYAIIGGRRIGKTSIVARLYRTRLPAGGFRTIYHDCSTVASYDSLLATPIHNWQPEPPPNPPGTFGDLLNHSDDYKSLVILLDEADKLVPLDRPNHWRIFNALRALSNAGRAQVVLSGERVLREGLHDPASPLFNFTNEVLLGPLEYRAVEVLITQPMRQLEIEFEDAKAVVDLVWSFTSGHPNVVQRLCRRLLRQLKKQTERRITLENVSAVINDSDFQRKDFLETYWEAASHLEKIISLLMANDQNVRTLIEVRHSLNRNTGIDARTREVDEALQRLVDLRSILKRTRDGYDFAVPSFPKVVAGTITFDDMLAILVEDYLGHSR